jgi:ubiquinone/menaquinone biosynthesis C-methylase UbiE
MSVYASDHNKAVLQTHSWRTAENSIPYLLPHIEPGMTILDIGCGPGTITVDLAKRVPDGHVTGVDYMPGPLVQATTFAETEGVTNVECVPQNSFPIISFRLDILKLIIESKVSNSRHS